MFQNFKHQIVQSTSIKRSKMERSVASEIRQNAFPAGPLPRTPLGELITLPIHRHASPEFQPGLYSYESNIDILKTYLHFKNELYRSKLSKVRALQAGRQTYIGLCTDG